MTINRQQSGNSRISGKVGDNSHQVNVWKGPQPGDSYTEGEQNGAPTTLRFNSAFSDNGQGIFGRLAGTPLKGNWSQEQTEGDVEVSLDKAKLTIDVDPASGKTEVVGTRIRGTSQVLNDEGDENLTLLADGQQIKMSIDRQPNGKIEVRGKDGDGSFRFKMEPKGVTGSMRISGTMPEALEFLPVVWELYGNDSVQPPAKPLSFGSAACFSAFLETQVVAPSA